MSQQTDPTLIPFFDPTGIAIIGASTAPAKLGFGVARNLIQSGYTGAIYFVNPRGGRLLERPIFATIEDVPTPVDLALIIVPAPYVAETLAAVGRRGIHAAIILSGGFRETGPAGAALEVECLRVAREYDIRLIGPNCIGLVNTHLPLDVTFLPPPGPPPGDVAFISHSGAICAAVIDWARGQGFGLSHLISLGNQVDVRETDVLAPIAADPHTKVITLYLEGIEEGRRFVRAARRVTRDKPIIALKVGRYSAGRRAVASHTGALAGQESAFTAAFRRAGVIRANTVEEMFDWAKALAWCPLPAGPNVAVLTNAGGPGVTAADALESLGLNLALLSPATEIALREVLPADASVRNPVDMLAAATAGQYVDSLRILLDDPAVHSVLLILPPPPMESAGGVARAIIPIIYAAVKPVVIALMGERMIQEAVEYFRAARVPEYRFPERAASALAVLTERAERVRAAAGEVERPPLVGTRPDAARRALDDFRASGGDTAAFLPFEVVSDLLAAYGIPTPRAALATTADEAVDLAWQVGFPVALKVASPDVIHKSESGGVLLNLREPDEVEDGFAAILNNVRAAAPQAHIEGIHVQHMVTTGQEVIIGAVRDPQFEAIVMFGSGGVEVEGLRDVEFSLAPLNEDEAEVLLARTWAGRRLDGFRNLPPADRTAVLDIICRLGQLAADFPELAEIELNPVRVLAYGEGAFAVDARARLGV